MKLSEILYQKTNDDLKQLTKLIGGCGGVTRKAELVDCITQTLLNLESLRQVWDRLDKLSQQAVAAAYHNDGEFNAQAFAAQYGQLPARPKKEFLWSWHYTPILLDLFIYDNRLPADLMPLVAQLAPPPERYQVQGLADAPEVVLAFGGEAIKLTRADTERAGLHDLTAYLRLVAQGDVNVSSTTGNTTVAGIKKILNSMLADDFLPLPKKFRANQTIRPFGLDVFARESGLVTYSKRSGLRLTEAGEQYFQTSSPEILLEAFETWTQEGEFDELSRITALKGLNARSTRLTDPSTRREAVVEALSWCPVNVWINIEDFYRALKIWHFDFEVETTHFSNLYVGHKEYGMLYGDDYWSVTKGLYANVVVWEYLGSIGAVDLLYTEPEDADLTPHAGYYYDDPYLSPYDGLRYFRINNLGAYLLGQAGEYVPSKPLEPPLFAVSANMQVTLTNPATLTPNDQHQLELLAVPQKNGDYQLDTQQLLTAIEEGHEWEHLLNFLRSRHHGPLPDSVEAWLEKLQQNSRAFKVAEPALLVKVNSEDLVEMALADSTLGKFCEQIGKTTLVIPAGKEKSFRERLKELEYVLLEK